ncbi:MAG: hypothetical protein HYU51_09190 [Candidatus Rokubacteria bacterium]|nr:hypothetical protein [Candidatus Rokubacteria bacterium]
MTTADPIESGTRRDQGAPERAEAFGRAGLRQASPLAALLVAAAVTCLLATAGRPLRALAQAPGGPLVTLADASGHAQLTVRGSDARLTVHDAADRVVGHLKIETDRVKLRDLQDRDRWKIKRKAYGAEIEDGAGRRLYRVRRDGNGWKLEDAGKRVLARVKPKADALEVRDADGRTIAKSKRGANGLVFETDTGRRTHTVSGHVDLGAGTWLALERFSLAERAALWAYFAHVQR